MVEWGQWREFGSPEVSRDSVHAGWSVRGPKFVGPWCAIGVQAYKRCGWVITE